MIDHLYLPCLYAICTIFLFIDSSEYLALFCFLWLNFILLFHILTMNSFNIIILPFLQPVSLIIFLLLGWTFIIVANAILFSAINVVNQRSFIHGQKILWDKNNYTLKRDCKAGIIASVAILHVLLYSRNLRNNLQILLLAILLGTIVNNCILAEQLSRNLKVATTTNFDFLEKNMFIWKQSHA